MIKELGLGLDGQPSSSSSLKSQTPQPQKMTFESDELGIISALCGGLLMGRWFHTKGEGTFRLESGGTAYVKNLTDWINLMQDGKRV
jgi:hypothetical protein